MTSSRPTVSIIMPTYNQAKFLPTALDSILAQTFGDFELIACDDGSNDETSRILHEYGVMTCRHPHNVGTAAAINSAAKHACGRWWTWVSSDNTYRQDWLDTLLAASDEDVGAIYSGFWYHEDGQQPLYHYEPHEPQKLINREDCYYGPSFLIRSGIWQSHRGKISHDYDNWLRVEESCWLTKMRIVGVNEALCWYLAHDQRATVTRRAEYDAPIWQAEARIRREIHELAR